jgi:hypothetical protein
MLVSLVARSLSIPTVDGVHTAVELSPERITAKSIVRLPTSPDGSQSRSSMPNWPVELSSSFHMPLVSQSHYPCSSRPTGLVKNLQRSLSKLSARTLTCDQVSLSRSLILRSQSISRPQRTVISPTRTSHGRSQRPSSYKSHFYPLLKRRCLISRLYI